METLKIYLTKKQPLLTGATAVQCIPHLGAATKELYVFQRTPSSIDVRAKEKPMKIGSLQ